MDSLNKRFEGFGKEPSTAVWDRIEQQLDGNKNPVGGWYYFVAACIALALSLGYLTSMQNETDSESSIITQEAKNKIEESKKSTEKSSQSKNIAIKTNDEIKNKNPRATEIPSNEGVNTSIEIYKKITEIAPTVSKKNNSISDSNKEIKQRKSTKTISKLDGNISVNDEDPIQNKSNDGNAEKLDSKHFASAINHGNSANSGSLSTRLNSESNGRDNEVVPNKDLVLGDLGYMQPKEIHNIENFRLKNPRFAKEITSEFGSASLWNYTAAYYQGLSTNTENVVNRYFVTLPESVTENIQNVDVITTYTNERPMWANATVGRNISPKMEVLAGIEYGELKSFLVQNDLVVNKNTNKSLGGLLGVNYKLKNNGKVHISLGSNLIVANSKDNWVRNLPDPTPNATINQYAPTTFSTNNTFDINLDQSLRVPDVENENLTTITSEINATIGIHVNKHLQVNLKPFTKHSLRKKFAGSSAFSLPIQYGLGVGIGF